MGERVAVLSPEGQFGTVDAADAEAVTRAGGKVLTKQEAKAQELEQAYQAKPTLEKVAGFVAPALPYPVQVAVRGAGYAPLPPVLEAHRAGAAEGFSLGAEALVTKKALEIASGKDAANAFVKQQDDLKEAHPDAYKTGILAGITGSAIATGGSGALSAGKLAAPGAAAITGAGEAIGGAASRALAPLAARGVLGSAAAAAGEMAVRGAAEGALYNAANYTTDAYLHDHELAGQKLLAAVGTGALGGALAGGALGGAGSLAGSALKGAKGGIARLLSRGEPAAEAATSAAAADASKADAAALLEAGPGKVESTTDNVLKKVKGAATDEGLREIAYDRAWRATGAGKKITEQAETYLKNGAKGGGEVFLRHGIFDTSGKLGEATFNAGMNGAAADVAERMGAARATVGKELGDIVSSSGAHIEGHLVDDLTENLAKKYEASAATQPMAESIRAYGSRLRDTLGIHAENTVSIQDLMRERLALDKLAFDNPTLNPGLALQVKRELRADMEGLITKSLDDASGKIPGELKSRYEFLKNDYQALKLGQLAAEDSAVRGTANRTFSPTAKAAGFVMGALGLTHGPLGLVAGPAAAALTKGIQERGDAAAAVFLHKLADMGAVSRAMAHVDHAIERASTGALAGAAAKPLPPTAKGPIIIRAQQAMQRVSAAQADPQGYVDRLTKQTEALGNVAPRVAAEYVRGASNTSAFLASKMPVQPDPDPLDPHPAPMMTAEQAHSFMSYVEYADHPMKFFDDLEAGKLTMEGAETARALMPKVFAQLQMRTAEKLSELLAKGAQLPFADRERVGLLLDIPAVPAQRVDHMQFLQSNVQSTPANGNKQPKNQGPSKPSSIKIEQSKLDRLEGR